MLKNEKLRFKHLIFLILFCFMSLQNQILYGNGYSDFFKWNKPNHIKVLKPDIDTIFKLGRIYYGLKSINLEYTEKDFIKDLKSLGFTKKEIQYYEKLDLLFFMEKYVNEIEIFEKRIDRDKLVKKYHGHS